MLRGYIDSAGLQVWAPVQLCRSDLPCCRCFPGHHWALGGGHSDDLCRMDDKTGPGELSSVRWHLVAHLLSSLSLCLAWLPGIFLSVLTGTWLLLGSPALHLSLDADLVAPAHLHILGSSSSSSCCYSKPHHSRVPRSPSALWDQHPRSYTPVL